MTDTTSRWCQRASDVRIRYCRVDANSRVIRILTSKAPLKQDGRSSRVCFCIGPVFKTTPSPISIIRTLDDFVREGWERRLRRIGYF